MDNNIFLSHNKGLLFIVVLCCSILHCTPPPKSCPTPALPDPFILLQQNAKQTITNDSLLPTEIALLQTGDVLLRRGYGLVSDYILATLQEPYSITHCGLIVQQNKNLVVLHTASSEQQEGIQIEPLERYVRTSQAHSLVACRPRCTAVQHQLLLEKIQYYQQQTIPFDYSFDDKDAQALYCIELLRNIFLEVFEEDYLPLHYQRGEVSLLGFQNFFDSSKFIPLFNHCLPNNTSE